MAAPIAMEQFIKEFKIHGKIFRVLQKSEKPSRATGAKGLLKLVTGIKQNPTGIHKVYIINVLQNASQADRIFNVSLLRR